MTQMDTERKLQHPEVIFSPWTPWAARTVLEDVKFPGVYLLAHLGSLPAGPANPQAKEVIYVGETSLSLKGRWRQFHRSAFGGKPSHAGGITYRKVFSGRSAHLYVAAYPVKELDEKTRPFFIRHIERKLLWEYVQKWDEPTEV